MNFGPTFINWVEMLHSGATTCFILNSLTVAIEVNFSIRQGDPLAMLLYVVYIEPLLRKLEHGLTGLQLRKPCPGMGPLDSYCDDLNIMTNNLHDFAIVDTEVKNFELLSGAILSRSFKSKVIGFGAWSQKEDWPLNWLSCVKNLKVFGIYISDSFNEIMKLNWDHRLQKFRAAILSWSSRMLTTVQQRIDVVKTFALSRTYYVASILPIRSSYVKSFETIIRKFIWKGSFSVMKVALDELKNKKLKGGLQLPCLSTMGRSLLISQCLRLLKYGDRRYVCHLDYWLGTLLSNILPNMGLCLQATSDNLYFTTLGDYLASIMVSGFLTSENLKDITNKQLYLLFADFPLPKIVRDNLPNIDYGRVWERLYIGVLSMEERQILFLLIHNKLPVQERLFRIAYRNDPYCRACHNAVIADTEHFFCDCILTKDAWIWLRTSWLLLLRVPMTCRNIDLLTLFFPRGACVREMVWMLGKFVHYVWTTVFTQETAVKVKKLVAYLQSKFKAERNIMGLSKLDNILG